MGKDLQAQLLITLDNPVPPGFPLQVTVSSSDGSKLVLGSLVGAGTQSTILGFPGRLEFRRPVCPGLVGYRKCYGNGKRGRLHQRLQHGDAHAIRLCGGWTERRGEYCAAVLPHECREYNHIDGDDGAAQFIVRVPGEPGTARRFLGNGSVAEFEWKCRQPEPRVRARSPRATPPTAQYSPRWRLAIRRFWRWPRPPSTRQANGAGGITANVAAGLVSAPNVIVGQSLEVPAQVALTGAPSTATTITLTSSDPNRLRFGVSATDAGAGTIPIPGCVPPAPDPTNACKIVKIGAGQSHTPDIYFQGLDSSGSVTYTANVPGFGTSTGTVQFPAREHSDYGTVWIGKFHPDHDLIACNRPDYRIGDAG